MTGSPRERLAALGITLPEPLPPKYVYVPTRRTGDTLYVSGQLPFVDGKLSVTGKVGAEVTTEQAKELARLCGVNALAAVEAAVGLDQVAGVVKVVGFVASAPGYADQPTVINGVSELFGEVFGEAGRHARSAVGVAELPLNTPVEVEAILELKR